MRAMMLGVALVATTGCATTAELQQGQVPDDAVTIGVGPSFSLASMPLYSGETTTVTVTGARPDSYVALVGSVSVFGPAACFPGLLGVCSDLPGPGFIIDLGRADAAGVATLTASPPAGYPSTQVHMQVLTYKGGTFRSSFPQSQQLYDKCEDPTGADPAPFSVDAYSASDLSVSFASPIAPFQTYGIFDGSGTEYASTVSFPTDDEAVISPDAALPGFTQLYLGVRNPCGDTSFAPFTTGEEGSFNPDEVVGNAYVLDMNSVVLNTPAELNGMLPLLAPLTETYAAYVSAHDAGAGLVTGVGARLRDDGAGGLEQDTCRPTDIELDLDTSANPGWSAAWPQFGAGELVTVEIEAQDAGASVTAHGTGYVIALDVVRALGMGNDEAIACDLLDSLGAPPCVPCPISTAYQCVFVDVEGTAVHAPGLSLGAVSEGDALAECGTLTPWY